MEDNENEEKWKEIFKDEIPQKKKPPSKDLAIAIDCFFWFLLAVAIALTLSIFTLANYANGTLTEDDKSTLVGLIVFLSIVALLCLVGWLSYRNQNLKEDSTDEKKPQPDDNADPKIASTKSSESVDDVVSQNDNKNT